MIEREREPTDTEMSKNLTEMKWMDHLETSYGSEKLKENDDESFSGLKLYSRMLMEEDREDHRGHVSCGT